MLNFTRFLRISILSFLLIAASAVSQDNVQKIDELAAKYYELGQFNGSLLVAEGGKVIYAKGFGYADMENKFPNRADTKFRLASVTKQFTATLIMQLVEKGKIKLEE